MGYHFHSSHHEGGRPGLWWSPEGGRDIVGLRLLIRRLPETVVGTGGLPVSTGRQLEITVADVRGHYLRRCVGLDQSRCYEEGNPNGDPNGATR